MHKLKKKHKLRLSTETVRTLTPDRLSNVVGGALATHSWCDSEMNSCSGCNTAACSNVCNGPLE